MEHSSIPHQPTEVLGYLWVAEEISLAIAPVFLLTAIATFLVLFSGRIGRIADRFAIEQGAVQGPLSPRAKALLRRMRIIQSAIICAVSAGLLISTVVILIFLSDTILGNMSTLIAIFFVAAIGFIWLSLLLFLAEISYAAAHTTRDISD